MNENRKQTGIEVAVIGMSGRFPGASSIHEFWNNLEQGTESISFFTDEELEEAGVSPESFKDPNYVNAHGELQNKDYFDASFFGYSPNEAEAMSPQMRVFHECAWEALETAGYDPTEYRGSIGMYGGASSNLAWEVLTIVKGMDKELGRFGMSLLSNSLFSSSRVSHKLGLTGPTLALYTACSTSLVAVHLACRALLTGECDIALAGGVSISHQRKEGYLYHEGMILSPDGHNRTFDEKAQGTVFGEGVGVVVLKRLKAAIADGDNIVAVIKGSSINNDGSDKSAFTAPSKRRIAEVARKALAVSKVDPHTITYVEAHGTATPLGDTIEIGALTAAFNSEKRNFCKIGSVKTNIGHLDVGAGVAAFIKTVLALKHKAIPPSLHFETPNPSIDFEHSPFEVNTRLTEWQSRDGYPLRAAVNSAGIGGTNAFVVLEEAPEIKSPPEAREWHLLLMSAKNETALNQAAKNLADCLEKKEVLLGDAAYTLQVGRKAFQHRRMLVGSGLDDAARALSGTGSSRVKSFVSRVENREIIFMFPGLGSQYINMGLELYQKEPVFREEMERCFGIVKSLSGYELKEMLYPSTGDAGELDRFEIAQVVIFIIEYALARLLFKWGIKPHGMIGYSFGEYTAACLAGVFSLEHALELILYRGQLIKELPRGVMLSVPLPKEELMPLLPEELAIGIDNGPSCIVSGPKEDVDKFEMELKEKRLLCMPLQSSHAIHSRMMEPILEKFKEKIRQVPVNKPQIPYISNVTGTWVTAGEVTDPDYWAKHLAGTVQFADGIAQLIKKPNSVFLEVGPGRDLCALLQRYIDKDSDQHLLNLIRHPGKDISDVRFLLSRLGQLWLYGIEIDWPGFYSGEKRHRVPLPAYPFQRRRFHVEGDPFQIAAGMMPGNALLEEKSDIADWFYIPSWKRTRWPGPGAWEASAPSQWLLFIDECGLGAKLALELEKNGKEVTIVRAGADFAKTSERRYTVNPSEAKHYGALFKELVKTETGIPGLCIHLWGVTGAPNNSTGIEDADKVQELGFYSLLNIAQSIEKQVPKHQLRIVTVTDNMQEVFGEDELFPLKSTVLGAVKGIPKEYRNIDIHSMDIVLPEAESSREENLIRRLFQEFVAETGPQPAAIRDNYRWEESYESVLLAKDEGTPPRLKQDGVYMVTGGLGGIGYALAEFLAKQTAPKLILTGRSPIPPREQWKQWLEDHGEDNDQGRKILKVLALERLGAETRVFSADVTNLQQMQHVVGTAEAQFGQINGVIHTAGVPDGTLIQLRTKEVSEKVLAPKVKGTLVLDSIFKDREVQPDFLVLCSSLDAIIETPGQVSYCAANIFLDAFARYKAHRGDMFTLSVNWPRWKGIGIAVITEEMHKELSGDELQGGIHTDSGVEIFNRLLEDTLPQVAVSNFDLESQIEQAEASNVASFMDSFEDDEGAESLLQRPDLDSEYVAPRTETEKVLAGIWAKFFGFEPMGIQDDFFEMGGDSLKALMLLPKIHKELDVEVSIADFFTMPTIEKLAAFLPDTSGGSTYSPIVPAGEKEYYVLSSAQKRLFVLQQMEKNSTGYNQLNAAVLEGNLDREKLEDTFRKLIERHESFRTSFEMIENEPMQKVHKEVPFSIQYHNITGNVDEEVEEIVSGFIRPFDLSCAPLLRVALINLPTAGSYILLLDPHHIIMDGTSAVLFFKDLMAIYSGEELPPLRVHYKDFSEWHNSEDVRNSMEKQEAYWLEEFQGEIPLLELPADFPRPAVRDFAGHTLHFEISRDDTAMLRKHAAEQGVTLFMMLLALYNILLSKISGREDIVVGTPTAGRVHTDLELIIGMFVNTLALRNFPTGDKKVTRFLEEVKERTLAAFSNQDYQYEELVEKLSVVRDTSRNPLFDTMFILQNFDAPEINIPDLILKPNAFKQNTSRFDVTLQIFEKEDALSCSIEYRTSLFKESTAERLSEYFTRLISAVNEKPGIKMADIGIISEEEKRRILVDFNDTDAAYPRDKTIHQLFEEQAVRTPENIAIVGKRLNAPENEDHSLTYRELDNRSNHLASRLREKGVAPGSIVAIMAERSLEMMVGIFGIIKAGGAYLPIAPDYPEERIRYMLSDSDTKVLMIPHALSQEVSIKADCIPLDNVLETGAEMPEPLSTLPETSGGPAYVIYTSGSTGKPKGVIIQHSPLVNRINWMQKQYPIGSGDTLLQKTPFTFDVSVWELFWWSTAGARLCLLVPGGEKDPSQIIDTIENNRVTVIHFVPSMLSAFLEYLEYSGGVERLAGLKQVITSGEALTASHVNRFYERFNLGNASAPKLDNLYGPTEATIDVSYFSCAPDKQLDKIPIGKSIDNTQLFILDKYMHVQPVGIAGELCIAGDGLALGYLNRPQLTAEKFVEPAGEQKTGPGKVAGIDRRENGETHLPSRFYKTGDLALWMPDGNIQFLGRIDHQVKIRGFRIELGEIETQLLKIDQIQEAVVLVQTNSEGGKYLTAFIVSPVELSATELREPLLKELPEYMIPASFVKVDKIPLTPNGKINRKALELKGTQLSSGTTYVPPQNDTEEKVAAVWKEVLGLDKVGSRDNFFDLGGNSINIIKVNNRVVELFAVNIPVISHFRYTTIHALAQYLDQIENNPEQVGKPVKRTVEVNKIKKSRSNQKNKRRAKR